MKGHAVVMVLVAAVALFAWSSRAATVTVTNTARAVDGHDVAVLSGAAGTDKWWTDTTNHGQTFRTGNSAVRLKAFALQTSSPTKATKTYDIRVGKVSGNAFMTIVIETGSQIVDMAADDYIVFTFDTPVELEANTRHGVDVEMTGSTSAWQQGIPYIHRASNSYAEGQRYTRGDGDPATISLQSDDRIFHLDLEEIPIVISGLGVSGITPTSATVNATLDAPNTNADVYVYWGTTDGTNNASSWTNFAYAGSWTNVVSTNVSYTATGLVTSTQYYYTFRGTNDTVDRWADASESFLTIGTPAVTNRGGATDVKPGRATLHGELTAGGSATATICWGEVDGGTSGTGAWEQVESMGVVDQGMPFSTALTGLVNGTEHNYRVYTTNASGEAWSAAAAFTPPVPAPSRPGNIAIYAHETTAEGVVNPEVGADYDLAWDTVVREDSPYSLAGDAVRVAAAAGHHLVLHSARYDAQLDVNNRREIQQYIVAEGSLAAIGWAQGYTRGASGADEAVLSGGGVIELSSNGVVSIQAHRTDSLANDDVDRIADASGLQLLKLDDNWDYCRLSLDADQAGPTTGAYVPLQYNVQDELDAGSFGHTSGSADITLKKTGHYLVFANTYLFCSEERTVLLQRLSLDGNPVDGSLTTAYIRGNQHGCSDGAAALGMIVETTGGNQLLTVEGALAVARTSSAYKAGKTAITIVKLPDVGDFVRLDDSGTDDFNPATPAALGWDTDVEIDSNGFSHSNSQVTVAAGDDYLFLTALYDSTDNADRQVFWQRWSTNGAANPITYANAGGYARNDNTRQVGNFSGILLAMTEGSSIEVISQALAAGNTLDAESKGLQGMRLGSIFDLGPIYLTRLRSSNVTSNSATVSATLGGTNGDVTVYWKAGMVNPRYAHTGWDGTNGPSAETTGTVERAVANLTADAFYSYAFHAIDGTTGSNAWAAATFATALTSAQTPVFTGATSPEYILVELEWQDNANTETGYVLKRSEAGSGGPYAVIAVLGADSTAYTDRDVLASSAYYYQLAATNAVNGSGTAFAACQTPATTGEAPPGLLFSDTFDRPDSTDLNASRVGKAGILGPLNYSARTFDAVILDINNNTVRMNGPAADGNYGGLVYINDHNFTDAAILKGGGFSVSMDIAAYSTAGSGRYMGIGVGQSLAELDAQTGVGPARSPGDLFAGFRQTTDALEIYRNGVLDADASVTGGVPDAPASMRIEYAFSSFNAGSRVDYGVFFDDSETPLTTGSFTWSGTGENHFSFSSNLSNDNRFDNLEIRANPALAPPGMMIIVR